MLDSNRAILMPLSLSDSGIIGVRPQCLTHGAAVAFNKSLIAICLLCLLVIKNIINQNVIICMIVKMTQDTHGLDWTKSHKKTAFRFLLLFLFFV